ncbi:MAG: ATP-binding protein [Candidatus Latescibacterota bacterium]
MRAFNLRAKFILTVAPLILLLGTSVIYIEIVSVRILEREFRDKGFYIALSVAAASADLILTDRAAELQKGIDATQADEPDISYLYVANSSGEVLSHTFEDGFPLGLEEINVLTEREHSKTKLLRTERGLVRDTVVPILGGQVGFVHVGFWEERAIGTIHRATRSLLGIAATIMILGVGLGYALVHFTVKPIEEVAAGVKAVGRGELGRKVAARRRDEVGALVLSFNRMTDDLARSRVRLEKTQRQLVQSEKLGATGRLAAGVAHEINNAVNAILNGVEILFEKRSQPLVNNEKYLNIIRSEAHLCKRIVRGLLDFSRLSKIELASVNVNDVMEEMILLLEGQSSFRGIAVVKDLAEDMVRIQADAGQLGQVFTNLALNAADAMPQGGELRVGTRYLDGKGEKVSVVQIVFEDTGCGIPPETIDRIFEPFFSTKGGSEGLGLGLSVVYGIIQSHSGRLDFQSKVGEGATFLIELPVGEQSIPELKPKDKSVKIKASR